MVNWTPSTGYLARLPTKHTFLHLTFQFVSQRNVQELPIHNQDSLYFILVVSGSDLIVKVWFVCIVLALAFLGFLDGVLDHFSWSHLIDLYVYVICLSGT